MKCLILIILLTTITHFVFGQKPASQIEIKPFMRTDRYAEFPYLNEENTPNVFYIKIKGTSWGVNLNYKLPLNNRNFFAKMGIGYYRYSFNEMHNHSKLFGPSRSRVIGYPSTEYILFYTNKYWYNTVSANIGVEKLLNISRTLQLAGGVDINDYFTFSQYYRIPINYPTGPRHHKYKTYSNRYFGFSINIHTELLKRIDKKISIGPSIIFPVFDLWKEDKIFPTETNSKSRNKWLRGIGFGISANYSLTKK